MRKSVYALASASAMAVFASMAMADNAKPESGTYNFDPNHSSIAFTYDHLGFSESHGLVRGVTGTIVLDAADPAKSTVEASFPLSSIVTVAPALDEHLRTADLFNSADGSAVISFKSTKVDLDEDGDEAKITGELTMNGVTKEVVLDTELLKAGTHPMTNKSAVGFDAETKIKRSDFNLGFATPAVSDELKIEISVEAEKAQ